MGDEDKLRYEMLDAVRGKTPRSDLWKKSQGADSYFSGAGSQNIWLMRFVTQALRNQTVPWEAVYNYQLGPPSGLQLIARDGSLTLAPEPAVGDKVYTPGFGGSEFMSTIYWAWHVLSHLALSRKGGAISERARKWAALNWALFRAIQAPDGSLMLFGQRSAGHNPIPGTIDWIFALASDGDVARAEAWSRQAHVGLKRSWEFEIGNELRTEMRETWQQSLSINAEDLPGLLSLRVPTEIVRTTEGLAIVHAENCNPNTPPILAGVWRDGRRELMPPSGGHRIRQKFDHATARIDGSEIVYASSLYTDGAEQRLSLPGGDLIQHLKLGSGSAASTPIDVIAEPSDTAQQPGDQQTTRDLGRAAALIAGLLLAKSQKQLQADVIAKLQGVLDDDAVKAIAVQVRSFGINPGQPQAVQWREALVILES